MSKILRCEICSTFCTTEEALEKHRNKHKQDEEKEKDGNSDKRSKSGSKDEKIKKDESDRSRSSKRDSKDSSSHSRRSSRSGRSADRSKIRSRSRDRQRGNSNDRSRRSGYRSDSSRDRHSYHRRDRRSSRSRRHDDKREDQDADLSELLNSGEWEVTDEVVEEEMDMEEEKVGSSSKDNDSKNIANDTSDRNSGPLTTDDKGKPTSTVDKKNTPVATDKKENLSKKPSEEAGAKSKSEETNDNGLEEVSDVATEDEDTAERKSVLSREDDTVTKGQKPAKAEKLTPGKAGPRKEADVMKMEENNKEDLGEEFVPSRMTSFSKHATQTNQTFSTFRDCGSSSKHHNKDLREVTIVIKKLDAKNLSSDLKISSSDIALMSKNKENVDLISQQILESVVKKVIEQEKPKQASVKQSQPRKSPVKLLEQQKASVKQSASKIAAGNEKSNETKDSQLTNFKNYRIPKLSEKKNVEKDKENTDGKVKKYRRIIRELRRT